MAASKTEMASVLFVCMGNICRSPTAEGVMQKLVDEQGMSDQVRLDSAGTHAYHVGEPPDHRAVTAALERGVEISHLAARKVVTEDFYNFDLLLAMDGDNLRVLNELQPEDSAAEVRLLLHYSKTNPNGTVPDPYYGGAAGFERVLDLLEEVNAALLAELASR